MGEQRRRLAILYGSQTGNAQVIDGSVTDTEAVKGRIQQECQFC